MEIREATVIRPLIQFTSWWFAVYAAFGVVCAAAQTPGQLPLKQLVFDDCEAAKSSLESLPAQGDPLFVQYLIDVLQLKLSADLQPAPLPQVVTKWQDPSVARLDAAQLMPPSIGPLGVLDSATERAARRCAVQLLGMISGSAAPSIPELVRYASQSALDDAARTEAEAVLFRIAAASGAALPAKALVELVQDFSSNREELVRSVLLIVAPTRILYIASLLLAEGAVPEQSVAKLFQELFWGDRESARSVFQDHLTHGEYAARRRALRVLAGLGWTLEALAPLVDAALVTPVPETTPLSPVGTHPTLAEAAARIILGSTGVCARIAPPLVEGMLSLLSQDGIVGDAAVSRLSCAVSNGQISADSLQRLKESSDVLVRRRIAQLALDVPAQSGAKLLRSIAKDSEVSVREALLKAISAADSKPPDLLRSAVLILMQTIETQPPSQMQREELLQGVAQLVRLGLGPQRAVWVALMPRILSRLAAIQGVTILSEQERESVRSVLRVLGKDARGATERLLAGKSPGERLLGAQLLEPISQGRTGAVGALVKLLGDPESKVREYALSALVLGLEHSRVALKAITLPTGAAAQGALRAITLQDAKGQSPQLRSAISWLQNSSCQEFLTVLSEPIVQGALTRPVVATRLIPCLTNARIAHVRTMTALSGDPELSQLVVRGVLDESLDPALIPVVLSQTERLRLSPREVLSLLEVGLSKLPIQEGAALLSYAAKGGLPEREAIKVVEDFAQRAGVRSPTGCEALWVASGLSGDTYNWKARFRSEATSDEEQFFTCAAYGRVDLSRRALIELLTDAPARKQAALLRRLVALSELAPDKELDDLVERVVQSPNDEIRCQGARIALRLYPQSPTAVAAVRRAIHGRCWDELSVDAERYPAKAVAGKISQSAMNYLEQVRALQLDAFSAKVGVRAK